MLEIGPLKFIHGHIQVIAQDIIEFDRPSMSLPKYPDKL